MGLTDLLFKKTKVSFTSDADGVLELDCSLSETHIDEAEVTSHPVEGGSETSDHIRKLPQTLEVNGIITNTPLVFLASVQAESPVLANQNPKTDRVSAGYDYLRKLMEDGTLIDVVTSLREYKNMALTGMSVIRDAENGNVLNCTLSLREVIIAGTLPTDLPLPDDVANKLAEDQGKKDKARASAKQDEAAKKAVEKPKSALAKLAGL